MQAPGNEEVIAEQTAEPDWYRYTLAVPMATPPGENSVYCSASPHLALGMLAGATGENPLDAFDRLVARPMASIAMPGRSIRSAIPMAAAGCGCARAISSSSAS